MPRGSTDVHGSWGFAGGASGKEHAEHANAGDIGDMGSIPGAGRSPEGEHGNPLQYPCPMNPMERGAWWGIVHMIPKSWTQRK